MRTTIDLSDELLRRAKIAAVSRGMTLKELIARALARELQSADDDRSDDHYVHFPIRDSRNPSSLRLTEEMIREVEAEDDMRRGLSA